MQAILLPFALLCTLLVASPFAAGGGGNDNPRCPDSRRARVDYGEDISCALEAGSPGHEFFFVAARGDLPRITALALTGSLDLRMQVRGPKGWLLHEGRAQAVEPSDFSIETRPTIGKSGRYSVQLFYGDASDAGDYKLAIDCITGPCEAVAEPATPIVHDIPIDGEITEATELHFFNFEGNAGSVIRLTAVTPSRLAADLSLYGPGGRLGQHVSTRLNVVDLTLDEDAIYTAVLSPGRDLGNLNPYIQPAIDIGVYSIGLSCIFGPCDTDSDGQPDLDVSVLPYSTNLRRSIDHGLNIDIYQYEADAGTSNHFTAWDSNSDGSIVRSSMSVQMQHWDPDGLRLPDNAFISYPFIPIQSDVVAHVSGTYTLAVMDGGGSTAGDYILNLECVSGPCDSDRDGVVDPVPAHPGYDQSVDGDLSTRTQADRYTFHGTAGTQIRVIVDPLVVSGFGGPNFRVIAPDGSFVDQGCCRGSSFHDLVLPQTGQYTVIVSSFVAASSGTYSLSLVCISGPCDSDGDGTPDMAPPTLPYDSVVADSIESPTDFDTYLFEANADTVIRLKTLTTAVTSGTFTRSVEIRDPDGVLIFQGTPGQLEPDDFNRNYYHHGLYEQGLAVIGITGTYQITVFAEQQDGTGDYSFELQCIAGPCDRDGDGVVDPGPPVVAFDQRIVSTVVSAGEPHYYRFHGVAGSAVLISIVPTYFPRLKVYAPSGDLPSSGSFRIAIQETGFHTIELAKPGLYGLELECLGGPCDSDGDGVLDPPPPLLSYGAPILATIDNNTDTHTYRFEGDAGTQVRIFAGKGPDSLGLQMTIHTPMADQAYGFLTFYSTSGDHPLIARPENFGRIYRYGDTLADTGTYTVSVRASAGKTGLYVIALDCIIGPCDRNRDGVVDAPPNPLAYGAPATSHHLSSRREIGLYSFHGTAGTTIGVSVTTPAPSPLDAAAELYGPDGVLIEAKNGVGSFGLFPTLAATGTYTVFIAPHQGRTQGTYTVSLSCVTGVCQ